MVIVFFIQKRSMIAKLKYVFLTIWWLTRWQKNHYNTGTQLNFANYNSLHPLIFFLSNLEDRRTLQEIPNSWFSNTDYRPMQLRISVFMVFFVLKRSLKLIRLEMNWLLCDFECIFFLIEDNLTYNYYMTKLYVKKVKLSENKQKSQRCLS